MTNMYKYFCVFSFFLIYSSLSHSASSELDRALEILLADYDIDGYLEVREAGHGHDRRLNALDRERGGGQSSQ